jgi:hypothetical protein
MGHADIATTMVYVHHVPQIDAADRLSKCRSGVSDALRPVSGHVRDTVADTDDAPETETGSVADLSEWARQDSNLGHTDYESAALTN